MATPAQKRLVQKRLAIIRLANNVRFKWPKWTGLSGKTGWDWLQVLLQLLGVIAIPLAIAIGTAYFSFQQNQTSMNLANDQQREITLQTYLDNMSDLLLNHNLRKSPRQEVSLIARERTLTTLRKLDYTRNDIVLQFLQDAKLIGVTNAVVDLSKANFRGDDLSQANLINVNLSGDDLSEANLSEASLIGANLSGAILDNANLTRAVLSNVNLSEASLIGANLSGAILSGVDLSKADLRRAILSGAILPTPTIASPTPQLVTVTSANGLDVRTAPTTMSAIIAHYPRGTVLKFVEIVNGQNLDGNPLWGRSIEGHFFWLGGTDRPNG